MPDLNTYPFIVKVMTWIVFIPILIVCILPIVIYSAFKSFQENSCVKSDRNTTNEALKYHAIRSFKDN